MSLEVAVLAGGLSLEREVSLRSGRRVAEALIDRGHKVTELDLDEDLIDRLTGGNFDVAFLTLHGKAGEDGTLQSLLDLLGLPYTGPEAIASATAWDKALFKGLLRRQGIPTPDWTALSADVIKTLGAGAILGRITERLSLPLMVKPTQGGASMGVRFVGEPAELVPALVASWSYHDVVLVEQFIAGTEVAVSIVGGEPLPAVEIHPKVGRYDFSARYTHGATEFYAPARLPADVLAACRDVALRAFELVGCRHVTRADMIVDGDGVPQLLELDTCPGMTETSLLPLAAGAADISFEELCDRLVHLAVGG